MADKLGVYIFKDLYKAYFWVWESTWFVHVGFLLQTLWLCRDMLASKCGVRTCVCVCPVCFCSLIDVCQDVTLCTVRACQH